MKRVSREAEEVLKEILEHKKESGYWGQKYKQLQSEERAILNSCLKELEDNEMIKVVWASDTIYLINVLGDGYLYEKRKSEEMHKDVEDKMITTKSEQKYDVFLSHTSADKLEFVDGLNDLLKKLGVRIFYDKESIEWGDNWKQKILDGTQKSGFAIIVISEKFFDREWTERELNEFLNRQNQIGQKLILPILHGITSNQLKDKYPDVADIQAIDSSKYSCDQIALMFAKQLIRRLRN